MTILPTINPTNYGDKIDTIFSIRTVGNDKSAVRTSSIMNDGIIESRPLVKFCLMENLNIDVKHILQCKL